MSQSESHPVRNGILATVIGGLILAALSYVWPPAKSAFIWLWGLLGGIWQALVASYSVPGWVLLLLGIFAITVIARAGLSLVRNASVTPANLSYTSDTIYGANWQWSWHQNRVTQLWASCPNCQGELVYVNNRDNYLLSVPHAKFFCEHCQKVIVDIQGGDREYALSAVEREINRRLRISTTQNQVGAS
jgi:hypothetical protein